MLCPSINKILSLIFPPESRRFYKNCLICVTIKTKKKYITNKPISRKLRISYLDSVIYRIFTKTKKGQFLQFCINFVKKSLNIETIMKLTFNATTLINLTSPDINQKHKLLALDYNSFSVKERSIIKNLQT